MAQQTRKDPRAKVLSMTVRYKSATLDEFIEHHSHDVSCGGMFIKTPQPFPPGTLLKFEVRIAEDRKVMQGVGRVVWKRDPTTADSEHPSGMGVKFIKLDDDSRRLIDQLVGSRREETSAFDAEGSQSGVDAETPVGLGAESLSISPPTAAEGVPSFFPKTEPVETRPPEDRTVMKQASELLEEALREVGNDGQPASTATSLASAERAAAQETTKPMRASASRLPPPRMPSGRVAEIAGPVSGPTTTRSPSLKAGRPSPSAVPHPVTDDMTAAAREITEKARVIEAPKPSSPVASPKPISLAPPGAVDAPKTPKPSKAPKAQQASDALRVVSGRPPAPESASGLARGLFWLAAVALCAVGTWLLWSSRPAEPPPGEIPTVAGPAAPEVQAEAKAEPDLAATAMAAQPAQAEAEDASAAQPPVASADVTAEVRRAAIPAAPELPMAPADRARSAVARGNVTTEGSRQNTPETTREPRGASAPNQKIEATPRAAGEQTAPQAPATKATPARAPTVAPAAVPNTRKSSAAETDNPY